MWILNKHSGKLIEVAKEDSDFLYYKNVAGNSQGISGGCLGRPFLQAQISLGNMEVITNPAEAYLLRCWIDTEAEVE